LCDLWRKGLLYGWLRDYALTSHGCLTHRSLLAEHHQFLHHLLLSLLLLHGVLLLTLLHLLVHGLRGILKRLILGNVRERVGRHGPLLLEGHVPVVAVCVRVLECLLQGLHPLHFRRRWLRRHHGLQHGLLRGLLHRAVIAPHVEYGSKSTAQLLWSNLLLHGGCLTTLGGTAPTRLPDTHVALLVGFVALYHSLRG
jgi:hypothetical protein